jgi:plastocyanin
VYETSLPVTPSVQLGGCALSERLLLPLAFLFPLLLLFVMACAPAGEEADQPAADETPTATSADVPSAAGGEEAPPGPTGDATIEGRVTFSGEVPNLRPLRMDADPACAQKHTEPVASPGLVVGEGNGLGNVLVRVVGGLPEGSYPAPESPVVMDQNGCVYRPHVMGAVAGQNLRVLNSDNLLHNVHSLSDVNPSFNRAMPANVTEATFPLPRPEEPFRIKCDVHPWMEAHVAVSAHPFFAVSAEDGSFSIAGLPAGSYELQAWHERLVARTATVEVADGETVTADFVFARE